MHTQFFSQLIVLTPPSFAGEKGGGEGGWASYQIFKKGAWQNLNF